MCSLNDSDDENSLAPPKPEPIIGGNCKKCGNQDATIVLRGKDCYCPECFSIAFTHKFRANLARDKMIPAGARTLLAHSGSLNCKILLQLTDRGLRQNIHKKLRLEPIVVHIEDGTISPNEKEKLIEEVQSCSLPLKFIPIESSILTDRDELMETDKATYQELIQSTCDLTAKKDLIKSLKRKLLLRCAKELQCSYILFADTATELAADSLINVSLGGGAHMQSDVGFVDDRDDIKILRPMRDFISDELKAYTDMEKIASTEMLNKTEDRFSCLQSRIKHFVDELQHDFPATVSTVLRTSSKLETGKGGAGRRCALCSSELDDSSKACSAAQASQYSESVSRPPCSCSPRGGDSNLCYRCRLASAAPLPSRLTTESIRSNMKKSISDFLLQ